MLRKPSAALRAGLCWAGTTGSPTAGILSSLCQPPPPCASSAFPSAFSQLALQGRYFAEDLLLGEGGRPKEVVRCVSSGFPEDCSHEAAPGEKELLNCQNKKSSKLLRPIEST